MPHEPPTPAHSGALRLWQAAQLVHQPIADSNMSPRLAAPSRHGIVYTRSRDHLPPRFSDCRTWKKFSHGSRKLFRRKCFEASATVKVSERSSGPSSSHATGIESGAPGFARVEYGATAVEPRPLRR